MSRIEELRDRILSQGPSLREMQAQVEYFEWLPIMVNYARLQPDADGVVRFRRHCPFVEKREDREP